MDAYGNWGLEWPPTPDEGVAVLCKLSCVEGDFLILSRSPRVVPRWTISLRRFKSFGRFVPGPGGWPGGWLIYHYWFSLQRS
jgi:hypothetical protein